MANTAHCTSSSCVEVYWWDYTPSVIRWRYPGEEWQEIEADDYQVKTQPGQCNTKYFIEAEATYQGSNVGNLFVCGETMRIVSKRQFDGNIISVDKIENPENRAFGFAVVWKNRSGIIESFNVGVNGYKIGRTGGFGTIVWNNECRFVNYNSGGKNIRNVQIKRVDGKEDNCGDCEFIVYKNGEIVYQETRDDCPEVEQLPCRNNGKPNVIKIRKVPFVSKIFVSDVSITQEFRGKSDFRFPFIKVEKLPPGCLNIYKVFSFISEPFNDTGEAPDPGDVIRDFFEDPEVNEGTFIGLNPYRFISQICSTEGCPTPTYRVLCDQSCQDCKNCPSGSCPVECGGHICCYDKTGKAIEQIPIADYCDEGTETIDVRGFTDEFKDFLDNF